MAIIATIAWLLILGMEGHGEGASILLIPVDHKPHLNFFVVIGEALVDAGHDVVMLTLDTNKAFLEKYRIGTILHHIDNYTGVIPTEPEELVFQGFEGLTKMVRQFNQRMISTFKDMFADNNLALQLEEKKFDIAIVDSNEGGRLFYLFPYRLGIPYMTLGARVSPWQAKVPALPSAEGYNGLFWIPNKSSFADRLYSLVTYIVFTNIIPAWVFDDTTLSTKYVPNKPAKSLSKLYRESEMTFVNLNILCLDSPRVSAPHFQYVGGVGTHPAEPLPVDIDTFVSGSKHGLIVVSFGSIIKKLPLDFIEKLLYGFRHIEQRVIMRHGNISSDVVPANVKIIDWLPQNDLLGHPQTVLFITHAGNNGQQEAVYHGVPMLSFPVVSDQHYNAIRAVEHGFGITLDWQSFTSEQLVLAIKDIIGSPVYKENIGKCSRIVKDFPKAEDTIAFWVDHVLKFGSSHLRPPYMEMPLWQFFMLDVVFILLLCVICFIFVVYTICTCICAKYRKTKQKAE